VKIPFTVKFRMGWDDSNIVARARPHAEDCGLNAVALARPHPRAGLQRRRPLGMGCRGKDAVKIPVIATATLRNARDAVAMGRPHALRRRDDRTHRRLQSPGSSARFASSADTSIRRAVEADRYQMIRTYFQMLVEENMHGSAGKMKQFVAWFTHGVPNGNALRRAVYDAKEGPAILASVESFL